MQWGTYRALRPIQERELSMAHFVCIGVYSCLFAVTTWLIRRQGGQWNPAVGDLRELRAQHRANEYGQHPTSSYRFVDGNPLL